MRVSWQEAALVTVIVWALVGVSQGREGIWKALLLGLPLGLVAGLAYWLLMPLVLRWAARGVKPREPEAEDEESTSGKP